MSESSVYLTLLSLLAAIFTPIQNLCFCGKESKETVKKDYQNALSFLQIKKPNKPHNNDHTCKFLPTHTFIKSVPTFKILPMSSKPIFVYIYIYMCVQLCEIPISIHSTNIYIYIPGFLIDLSVSPVDAYLHRLDT